MPIVIRVEKGAVKNKIKKVNFGNIGLNAGESEPIGTCEKTRETQFFAQYPLCGEASESVPRFRPILLRSFFDFYIFFTPKQWCKMQGNWSIYTKITKYFMQNYKSGIKKDTDIFIEKLNR